MQVRKLTMLVQKGRASAAATAATAAVAAGLPLGCWTTAGLLLLSTLQANSRACTLGY